MTQPVFLAAQDNPALPLAGRRICYVMHDSKFFLTHRREIAEAMIKSGAEVHLIAPAAEQAMKQAPRGVIPHHWDLDRWSMNPFRELKAIGALYRLYKQLVPDIVHHFSIKATLYGTMVALLLRIPLVVVSITGKGHVFTAKGVRAVVRRIVVSSLYRVLLQRQRVCVLFQTERDRSDFIRWGIAPPSSSGLIPGSGVDTDRFAPSPQPAIPPMVFFASRMLKEKGVLDFIEACKEIRRACPHVRCVMAGPVDSSHPDGISEGVLTKLAADSEIEFLGEVQDLSGLMRSAAVFCFPSTYAEGVPRVVLEAASSGVPIVSYPCDGLREVLRAGIVECRAASFALAEEVIALLHDTDRRVATGVAAREAIFSGELDISSIVKRTIHFYRLHWERHRDP